MQRYSGRCTPLCEARNVGAGIAASSVAAQCSRIAEPADRRLSRIVRIFRHCAAGGEGAGSEVWPRCGKSVTGIEFPIHVFVQFFYIAETCANVQRHRLVLAINHLHRRHPMIKNLASTFLACFALAACGGGEGNPGQCLGSAAVCSPAAGSSTAGNVSTVLPGPVGEARFAASSRGFAGPRPAR